MDRIESSFVVPKDELVQESNKELLQIVSTTLLFLYEGVIATDAAGKIVVMNKSAEKLTGWSSEEAYGREAAEVFHLRQAAARESSINLVKEVLATGKVSHAPADVVLIDKNGTERYIAGTCVPAIGKSRAVTGAIINFRDITTSWQKQKYKEYLSHRDVLTGAFNRFFFQKRIEEEISWSERYQEPVSMMMLDLDYFKRINDTWGHPVGDLVLKELAQVIRGLIRKTDFLVRLGGEEFIIVMPQTNGDEVLRAAEKIRILLEQHRYPVVGQVTVSIGVAEHMEGETLDSWYGRVDCAMYQAKESGRNCVKVADKEELRSVAAGSPKWQEEWESGHDGIDKQHRELLEMGKLLYDLSIQGTESETVLKQLDRVLKYLAEHIAYEEDFLIQISYPGFLRHKETHARLLEVASKLRETYTQRKLRPAIFFSFLIDDFIFGHILQEDNDYFPYV
nr:diguanylate cyclase [uncultured Anaeromusa sp.]